MWIEQFRTVIYYITANDTSYNNVTSATKSFTMRDSTPPVFIGYMITPSQTYSHSQINLTISIFDSTNVSVNATFMGRDSNVTYMMNRISKPLADGSYNYTVTANPIASRNGSIIIVLEAKDAYGNVAHKTIEIEILSSSEAISTEIVGKTRPGERISIVGKVESAGNYTGLGFELYIEFDNGQKENVELLPDGNYIYNFMIPSDISEGVHLFNLTLKDLFDKQMLKATIGFSYRLPHFNKVQSYDLSVILTIILAAILVGMLYVFKYRAGKSEDKEDRKEGKDNKNDTNKNDSNKE
ncbi:MAG: hypothetical protein QXT63_01005 [Thermoplasmata archaeon]